jgi:sec-independent protein translocase protein TatA
MSISIWQILLVVLLVILLFGRGKISDLMGDVAKGIKSFRSGLKDDEETPPSEPKNVTHDKTSTETGQTSAERETEKASR